MRTRSCNATSKNNDLQCGRCTEVAWRSATAVPLALARDPPLASATDLQAPACSCNGSARSPCICNEPASQSLILQWICKQRPLHLQRICKVLQQFCKKRPVASARDLQDSPCFCNESANSPASATDLQGGAARPGSRQRSCPGGRSSRHRAEGAGLASATNPQPDDQPAVVNSGTFARCVGHAFLAWSAPL